MRLALLLSSLCGMIAACGPAAQTRPDPFTASGEVIVLSGGRGGAANACFGCHGLAGEGDGAAAPRLAGLDAGYLQKQLDDYASGLRPDATMQAAVRWLSADDRRAVAAHYAALPAPAARPQRLAPPGLWAQGDAQRGVVACAVCHGDDGRGVGAANPSLAGQPAAYTLDQIRRWQAAERRNDARGVMAIAVAQVSPAQASAIADWLEGQPASPRPYSDAARLSAAEAAGARLAASRGTRRPGR